MSTSENLDDVLSSPVVIAADDSSSSPPESNTTNNNNHNNNPTNDDNNDGEKKNWLQKATSNVIQQVKSKKGTGDMNESLDDSIIVPTSITSMMDDTESAQEQKLWGMSTTSSSTTTTASSAAAAAASTTIISSYNSNSKQAAAQSTTTTNSTNPTTTTLTYDNFSFSPPPNFIPISSCDELEPLPSSPIDMLRDFDNTGSGSGSTTNNGKSNNKGSGESSSLKISSNFSKLLKNSKKVDKVRKKDNAAKRSRNKGNDNGNDKTSDNKHTDGTAVTILTSSKEADEYLQKQTLQTESSTELLSSSSTITNLTNTATSTVQKAQHNLIEQLKKSLDYLTNQNKLLSTQSDTLNKQISKQQIEFLKQLQEKQQEVEERNIKLAALEQHFMALNNPSDNANDGIGGDNNNNTNTTTATTANNGTANTTSESKEGKTEDSGDTSTPNTSSTSNNNITKTPVSSSIVQIDKSYLKDLELTVKLQKQALEKFESENKTLSSKVSTYSAELEKKERTITNLESTLKQGREARFSKKSKSSGHRRRSTESSVIISTKDLPSTATATVTATPTNGNMSNNSTAQSDDEFSISNASNANNSTRGHTENVQEAINNAVTEALTKQESTHQTSMDILNQQLDIKDKIIQRHEMKIMSLIKTKSGDNHKDDNNSNKNAISSPSMNNTRNIPPDVMLRNISVTNELMDTSIRKLEKMMDQLELIEKEKRTDLADEISPIRRVATKVSLVHEEMKVAIKLIEQKVSNDVEKINQLTEDQQEEQLVQEHGEDDKEKKEEEESGQTSGEGGDIHTSSSSTQSESTPLQGKKLSNSNIDDQIAQVLTGAMKAIKETEASVKSQIDDLTEQLQKVEFELVGKQDTIEALELACSEHVQNCRRMQEEIEQLKLGMMQV